MILAILLMRTKRQRLSRAVVEWLELKCLLSKTSSRKRSTKMRSWTLVALRSLTTAAKGLTPRPRGLRLL